MDIKNTTGSLYTDWLWLSRQCRTDASVSKLSSQVVRKTEKKSDLMGEQCGHVCPSQRFVGTSQWMSGLKEWKHISPSRGTAHLTTTQSYLSTDANQVRGLLKSQESSTQLDISSLWTSPKAKSQTVQPNTSSGMLWC